jgi:hypothetical protein
MKHYNTFLLFALITLATACEDPIDVELDSAEPQLVVDAWLDNISNRQVIRLSETIPYFQAEFTPGLENAQVSVMSGSGDVFVFEHESDGNYVLELAQGESLGPVGETFTLNIEIGNERYSSSTSIFRVPQIDSLTQEFRVNEAFTNDGIYCQVFARDFVGLGDTYWIKTFKNGQYLNRPFELNIAYDAGFDSGGEVDGFVFIYPIRDLINEVDDDGIPTPYVPGDEIKVEVHSISNSAFAFLEIMRDQLQNSSNTIFAEPLANTRGNIIHETGDDTVLGVFNVSAVSVAERIIE